MEKIIHAIFGTQEDAFKAQQKLNELDASGDISLAESYIISKDENGVATVKSGQDNDLGYTIGGALVGSMFGLLGGPLGLLFGASAGALAGATGDLIKDDYTLSYLEEVKKNLAKGKTVIVAHIYEDWEVPVNESLHQFGAKIYRLNFDEQVDSAIQKDLDELDEEIDAAEKSLTDAADEVKAGINEQIKTLKEKRKELAEKISEKATHQKQQYQSWIDKQKDKLRKWQAGVQQNLDNAKKQRLEQEIARHEEKLAALKAKL